MVSGIKEVEESVELPGKGYVISVAQEESRDLL